MLESLTTDRHFKRLFFFLVPLLTQTIQERNVILCDWLSGHDFQED